VPLLADTGRAATGHNGREDATSAHQRPSGTQPGHKKPGGLGEARTRDTNTGGPAKAQATSMAPSPTVGISVLVAHPLGAGAVPADLQGSGFEVVTATAADAAIAAVASEQVDVAVVDGRFEGDGLAFCQRLWKQVPGFPVLIVGPNDENLVTRALTAGVDDYVALPLRPAELVARTRAVLRRAPTRRRRLAPAQQVIEVGDVALDPASHEVRVRSQLVRLTLREFQLLRLLMENAGIVLTRSMLINRLWGPTADDASTSLEVHVRRLRSKIEEDPSRPQRIKTVRGVGYRYQAPH